MNQDSTEPYNTVTDTDVLGAEAVFQGTPRKGTVNHRASERLVTINVGHVLMGLAVVDAVQKLRARLRDEFGRTIPAEGIEASGAVGRSPGAERFSMHAFGAQFAEVRVDEDTGEARVPRLLGIFAVGRVINPKTARS